MRGAPHAALVDGELVPQRDVLQHELRAVLGCEAEERDQCCKVGPPGMLPRDVLQIGGLQLRSLKEPESGP
jgi:hypothetical protein